MHQQNQETEHYQGVEFNLSDIIIFLWLKKFFILSFTGFFSLLAIIYASNLPVTYQAKSSFILPNALSVVAANNLPGMKIKSELNIASISFNENEILETKESIFKRFLKNLSSPDIQKRAFEKGDFFNKFNLNNDLIEDRNQYMLNILSTIKVSQPDISYKDVELGFLNENPYSISIEGVNSEIIVEYLGELISLADSETLAQLINFSQVKTSEILRIIDRERYLFLMNAKTTRLNEIEQIKEEDKEKIREIENKIELLKYKGKINLESEIFHLSEQLKLAKKLEAIDNNFDQIIGLGESTAITSFGDKTNNIPTWYLHGEKALKAQIESLENRPKDVYLTMELLELQSELDRFKNNTRLRSLLERKDDSAFIPEIIKLDLLKEKIESTVINTSGFNSMELRASPYSISLPSNSNSIIFLAFFLSFFAGIVIASIMNLIKPSK